MILALAALDSRAAASTYRTDSDYLIDTWEVEEGLPDNSTTAMVQTSDGYLWFGTFNGLVRFDGIKFTVFNRSNTPGLPGDGIVNLYLDRQERLWVSTDAGLALRQANSVHATETRWRTFTAQDGWVGNLVRTFSERANGDLLLTTFDGHVLAFENDRLLELPQPPGEPGHGYFGGVDENGKWWLTQNRFVGRWEGQQWVSVLAPNPALGRSGVASAPARGGGLWILLGKELIRVREGREVSRMALPQYRGGVWSMMEDSRTNVWISSYDWGLFRVTPEGSFRRWTTTNGLGYHATRFVYEDRERNLWAGTSGGGLRRFKPRRVFNMSLPSPLPERVARSVWPASGGGVWMASSEVGLLHHSRSEVARVMVPGPRDESIYGMSVLEDRSGRLWYGDTDSCWWRRGRQPFEKVKLASGANVSALFEDSQGRVWIAAGQRVVVCEGNEFRELGAAEGLPPGRAGCFGEDSAGVVWLAKEHAVLRFDKERFVEVRAADGQPLHEVLCFKAEQDGAMWMGTRDRGLLRWRSGRLNLIGRAAGLPVQSVHAIIDDGLGHFWMTSNRGIVRATRKQLHAVADGSLARLNCQLLDVNDGLPSAACPTGQPTCARDQEGRLWFATQKGAAMVDPATFSLHSVPPALQIEQIAYQRLRTDSQSRSSYSPDGAPDLEVRLRAPFARPIELPPGSRSVEIEYAALSYSCPEKVQYQVKLEGVNHTWEDAKGLRTARYCELAPGEYVFHVRAANEDGLWNEGGASLAFTVQAFYWQTWWFRVPLGLLGVSGLAGAVWAVMRGKLRRQEEHLAHEREIRQAREQLSHLTRVAMLGELSGSLAHELNQPLTAILSNAQAALRFLNAEILDRDELRDILKDIAEDDQRAGEIIRRLRALVKRGEVQFQPLDVNDVVGETLRLVRGDIVTRNISLVTELHAEPLRVKGDRVQLQQVFLNLILNACDAMANNASENRKLTVRTERTDNRGVQMTVVDFGHGIPSDQMERIFDPFVSSKSSGLGLGLAISRSIVEAHGGKLLAANNPHGGASFSFVLLPHNDNPA